VPTVHGFSPTMRLYAGAYPWCSLSAASELHRTQFLGLLENPLPPGNR
jgi:hypothetical protein